MHAGPSGSFPWPAPRPPPAPTPGDGGAVNTASLHSGKLNVDINKSRYAVEGPPSFLFKVRLPEPLSHSNKSPALSLDLTPSHEPDLSASRSPSQPWDVRDAATTLPRPPTLCSGSMKTEGLGCRCPRAPPGRQDGPGAASEPCHLRGSPWPVCVAPTRVQTLVMGTVLAHPFTPVPSSYLTN